MLLAKDCLKKWGEPTVSFEASQMVLWDVPQEINQAIPTLPNKIYCNKIMVSFLEKAFRNIITRKLTDQVKTWDGCFNVRKKEGKQQCPCIVGL